MTLGLALPWYIGLGVAFIASEGTLSASSQTYALIADYFPLTAWGGLYLALGAVLLVALTTPQIPHRVVRRCCILGLMLTAFWLTVFVIALVTGQLDLVSVLPAWTTAAFVEFAVIRESVNGPMRPGPAGRDGLRGPAGATGGDGPAGAAGATGARGVTGARGADGPTGRNGQTGRRP